MRSLIIALVLLASPAVAAEVCAPIDNAARILQSPAPNDTHPDWMGESYVGTGWTFEPASTLDEDTGRYLRGDLVSPRGAHVNEGAFVLAREWVCQPA